MTHKTRVIELWDGQDRARERNGRTLWPGRDIGDFGLSVLASEAPFKEAFLYHYKKIRSVIEGYERAGVAIFAIEGSKVVASACVAAKQKRINVAIIGRHSVADLFLPDDESLSLRHLAVILYPHPKNRHDDLRVRVVDLRTATAFRDEKGDRCAALEAEGPLFFLAGRYRFMLFPTGEETPWPDDAVAGWECIPERIYLDDVPAEPDRWRRHRIHGALPEADSTVAPSSSSRGEAAREEDAQAARAAAEADPPSASGGLSPVETHAGEGVRLEARVEKDDEASDDEAPDVDGAPRLGEAVPAEHDELALALEKLPLAPPPRRFSPRHRTFVQNISGPSRARRSLLEEDDYSIGALRVRSSEGLSTIIVGKRAAREGALFGRYERCDNDGLTVLSNDSISRVHMLLIEIAEQLYVIDTASTNGIRFKDQERRVITLSFGKRWMLGDRLAWFEWLKA